MTNLRELSKRAPTIEDAKKFQRLVEHLKELRRHRAFLAHKHAVASFIRLDIGIAESQLPRAPGISDAQRRRDGFYHDGLNYRYDRGGWSVSKVLEHGALNTNLNTGQYNSNTGRLPTIGSRVMDGIRASVFDEIEATEKAISVLGFAIPPDET